MYKLASEYGGKCLSEKYINQKTKLKWQCGDCGNIWLSDSDHIRNREQWCPECSNNRYKRENICRSYFEFIFCEKFPNTRPKWLLNPETNQLLEIDGFSEKLLLGFEHQGEHHYKIGRLFSRTETELKKRQNLDKLKLQICKSKNIKLFIINYDVPLDKIPREIKKQALGFNMDISKYNFDIKLNHNKQFKSQLI